MRINEHFDRLEERILKLEKEVAALKAAGAEGSAGSAGSKAGKTETSKAKKTAAK